MLCNEQLFELFLSSSLSGDGSEATMQASGNGRRRPLVTLRKGVQEASINVTEEKFEH